MMKELLDKETLEAFTTGLQKGFNGVFDAYYQEVCYFSWKLTGQREEAEDVTADAFYKLFKMHKQFLTEANIRAFLYITVRNGSLQFLRTRNNRKTYLTDFSLPIDYNLSTEIPDELSQDAILHSSLIKHMFEAIQELPERSRRILQMLYFEGLNTNDIAERLSITRDTVRSQKRHALEQLRQRFSNNQMAISLFLALAFTEALPFIDSHQLFA